MPVIALFGKIIMLQFDIDLSETMFEVKVILIIFLWCLSSGDDATALDCYNQSIILAPFNTQTMTGEDLSIAAANRAAVFLRQEKFT